MARVAIFQGDKKRWAQYDQDTEVLMRYIGKKELSEISQKAQKAARLSDADVKELFNLRLGRAAVLGWRKIEDHDHPGLVLGDAPLPFTPQNLDLLMEHSLEFSGFVNVAAIDAKSFLDETDEAQEVKNG